MRREGTSSFDRDGIAMVRASGNPESKCGPPAGFLFRDFFWGGFFVFLQGILAKTSGRRWLSRTASGSYRFPNRCEGTVEQLVGPGAYASGFLNLIRPAMID